MALLMIDVAGFELSAEDKELLAHPKTGGMILFSRNFANVEQLTHLTEQVKKISANLLIGVDHEGGRVQRFRQGFSAIPAMGRIYSALAEQANHDNSVISQAQKYSTAFGYLMASEVQASGIDISFAPVLDVDDVSAVIGDRGFHRDPEIVSILSTAFIQGMHQAGMKATGKHFPGHGSVVEDSHIAMPIDFRSKQQIYGKDLAVFKQLMSDNRLAALMPAHVIYPAVDDKPVGFSKHWLQTVLRQELAFEGVLFSDDLAMQGASGVGGFVERCEAAAEAGCDMLLVCNNRQGVIKAIDNAHIDEHNKAAKQRLAAMLRCQIQSWDELKQQPMYQQYTQLLNQFMAISEHS